jgi:iron complex transport system substrate-binding protein
MTRLSVVACALVLALAGCGERPEPLANDAPLFPVTVRGAAEEPTTVERRPERIVALDAGAAELIEALGAGRSLVGVPAGVTLIAGSGAARVVRPSGLVDVDAVVRLDPDLIVTAESVGSAGAAEAEAETRAALYIQPDRSLRDVRRAVLELGFIVGEPIRAREIAASLRDAAARVERAVATRDPVRVFVDTGFFVPPPEDSLLAELVRRAGGESVAEGREEETTDACDLLRLGPEVVLQVVDSAEPDPAPSTLAPCGTEDPSGIRVEVLPEDLVTRPGPRAGEALVQIAQALHPNALP